MFEEPKTIGRALGNLATTLVLLQLQAAREAIGRVKELVRLQGEQLLNTQAPDERGEAFNALIREALAISNRFDPANPDAFNRDNAALQALLIGEGSKLVHWDVVRQHVHSVDDDDDF